MEYKRVAADPTFSPMAVQDFAGTMAKRADKEKADMRQFISDQREQDRQRIQDTKFVGQDLQAIAQFSETALGLTKDIMKDNYESKQINDYVDNITGVREEQAETAAIEQGNSDNNTAGPAVQALNDEGSQASSYRISNSNRVGRGVANERMLLQDSKAWLLSRVPTLLNDPNFTIDIGYGPVSVIDLKADPNNAALVTKYALRQAIKERGLQFTTKRAFKDILGGTIDQINNNTSASLASKAISDKQAEDKIKLVQNATSWGYSLRGKSEEEMQKGYNEIVQNSLALNTGDGRAATSRTIAETLVNALKDPDDIRRASGIKLDNGATLGGTFPVYFESAIQKAEGQVRADNKLKAEGLAQDGVQELQAMQAQGASIQEIENRRNTLTAQIGALDGSVGSAFNGRADTLVLNTMKQKTFDDLRVKILGGTNFSDAELQNSGLPSGQISALASLQTDKKTIDFAKDTVNQEDKLLKQSTFSAGGIKLDKYTQAVIKPGWLNAETLTRSLETFSRERDEHLRNYARTLRGKSEDEQRSLMVTEAKRWSQEQLYGDSGAFKALGILNKAGNNNQAIPKEEESAIKSQLRDFAGPNSVYKIEATRGVPIDYTSEWNPGSAIPPALAKSYGDRGGATSNVQFLTLQEAEEAKQSYTSTGTVPMNLVTAGESLGVSGLDFLNQQLSAYALDTIKPVSTASKQSVYFSGLKPGPDLTGDQRRSLYLKSGGALLAKGFTQNAATALARAFTAIPLDQWDSNISAMLADPELGKALRDSTKTPKQIIRLYNKYLRATGQ